MYEILNLLNNMIRLGKEVLNVIYMVYIEIAK